MRSNATRATHSYSLNERAVRDNRLPARGGEIVEDLMSAGTPPQQSWTQRCAAAASTTKPLSSIDNLLPCLSARF
jgi:hypothetical protein